MNILITGASGMLGSNLVSKMQKKFNVFATGLSKDPGYKTNQYKQFNLSEKKCLELLHVLKNQEKIISVKLDLWMHYENIDKLYLINKNHFQSNIELDISSFKTYTGLTRKFAIPVLEFCDQQGWTSRMGNIRVKGEKI